MNDADGPRQGRLHSRREILAGAGYGLGATLLFARPALARPRDAAARGRGVTSPRGAEARWSDRKLARLAGQGQPRSVCMGRLGILVVGARNTGDPVSWTKAGDTSWPAHHLERPAPGEPEVWGVAAHGSRFLAVGSVLQHERRTVKADPSATDAGDSFTFVSTRRVPTVWWTHDGARWAGSVVPETDDRHAQLVSVSCHTNLLVAVGSTLDADGVQGDGGLVLVSEDHGRTWRRCELPAQSALSEGSFTGITRTRGRWFATSTDIEGGAVWSSDDGRRWWPIGASARRFRGFSLQGIGARGGDVFLVATSLRDHRSHLFVSTDRCRTWQDVRRRRMTLDGPDATVNDLSVLADDVVVVGTRQGAPLIEGAITDVGN